MIIKRKKLSEKTTTNNVMTSSLHTPPGLSHSLPTSATYSETMDRTRSASIDSNFSLNGFDMNAPAIADFDTFNPQMHPVNYPQIYPEFTPYNIDVKTERQIFMDDHLTGRETTTSTFTTYHPPPPPESMLPSSLPEDGQFFEDVYTERRESFTEEAIDMNFFEFNHGAPVAVRNIAIELDENDQRLLNHFITNVVPCIFPILDTNQHGSARSSLILPALESNKCYLHCCLSISAQHLKAVHSIRDETIDNDIMRHRYATISELCSALNRDEEHQQILEATLGMIFFQCSVGRFDDSLPDIPWHQHFQAAISLVQKLELLRIVTEMNEQSHQAPFNMTLTSWIDILGATMQGRAPTFAHTYREKDRKSVV